MLLDDPVAEVRAIDRRSGLQSGTTAAPDHGGEALRRHLLIDAAALFVALKPASVDAAWLRAQTLAADPKRRGAAIAFVDAHRNFWGIWCGWCVKELPDLQKLHETYAADPDVAILTIDNDQNPSDVPPWMKQRGFTFPVLLDDGYVTKVGGHAFPTTWFLDCEGRKVFEKVGWSEKLFEEFGWRVEATRGATTPRSTAFRPFQRSPL